jgi:translation initiation factor 3 subunit C
MSKFFGQNSSSSSESESDNEENKIEATTSKQMRARFYESEEEETKGRVVLSEKAKRSEEINNHVKQLKNAKKIKDVVKANEIFEDMSKAYEKCKKLIENEGHFKQYIRAIAELEVFVTELWADTDWRKAASKNNATSLTKLRQRIKKYNKEFETEINDFKINPDNYPEEEQLEQEAGSDDAASGSNESSSSEESSSEESSSGDSEDDDDDDDEEEEDEEGATTRKSKPRKKVKDTDDEESTDWSSSENSDSSDDNIDLSADNSLKRIREQFIKKDTSSKVKKTSKKHVSKSKKTKKHVRTVQDDDNDEAEKPKAEKIKLFAKDEEINHENVLKKLNQIISGRGRKGTDRKEQIELMSELRDITKQFNLGLPAELKIILNQISVNFDYNPRLNKCMKTENWHNCLVMLEEVVDILQSNDNIEISDNYPEEHENISDKTKQFFIKGDLLTINDRLVHE